MNCALLPNLLLQFWVFMMKMYKKKMLFFFPPPISNAVTEDFESVFGPATDVKEIQITPLHQGKQSSALVPVLD